MSAKIIALGNVELFSGVIVKLAVRCNSSLHLGDRNSLESWLARGKNEGSRA